MLLMLTFKINNLIVYLIDSNDDDVQSDKDTKHIF